MAEDVVDSGPKADHENDLTTTYASGDILVLFHVINWFNHSFARSTTQ